MGSREEVLYEEMELEKVTVRSRILRRESGRSIPRRNGARKGFWETGNSAWKVRKKFLTKNQGQKRSPRSQEFCVRDKKRIYKEENYGNKSSGY